MFQEHNVVAGCRKTEIISTPGAILHVQLSQLWAGSSPVSSTAAENMVLFWIFQNNNKTQSLTKRVYGKHTISKRRLEFNCMLLQ